MGSSKEDLLTLPKEVISEIGYALYLAQLEEKHDAIKALKRFGGGNVLEIIEYDKNGTYRAVYTSLKELFMFFMCFRRSLNLV